jgi:transposase InsO family protein
VCQLLGVQHHLTTAYHPQANGMVERSHRQLKDALRARLAGTSWPDHLPWVLLGLRAAPKKESGVSSAELLYGVPLTLLGQFLAVQEPDL